MYITKKIIYFIIRLSLLSAFFFACGAPKVIDTETLAPDFVYVIGPEDILNIYVWKQPNLSLTVQVRIDGKISMPLINDVQAAGMTPEQLKDEITGKLSRYIEEPTVSVIVETINSLKIIISGSVMSPGVYKIRNAINMLEAITLAGGLGEWANPKKIKVIRKEGDVEKTFEINYNKFITGKEPKQNITIFPGDTIIVP
jgi:polysaccharide export outer membrane protein